MATLEVFSFTANVIGAITSIATVLISWKVLTHQRHAAQETQHLAMRATAAQNHDKYVGLLQDVIEQTNASRIALTEAASTALRQLYIAVDIPHIHTWPLSRMDHLIDEACDLTFKAIAPELVFQYGTHLRWRLNGFRDLNWASTSEVVKESKLKTFALRLWHFVAPAIKHSGFRPEYELWKTPRFKNLMQLIAQGFTHHDQQKLKNQIAPLFIHYHSAFLAHYDKLNEGIHLLDKAIRCNELEEFPLQGLSPKLYARIQQEKAQLQILNSLGLPEGESFTQYNVPHLHSWVVFFALILYLVQLNRSWSAHASA